MTKDLDDRPLSRTEATLAADFLQRKGKVLKSGWITLWKKRPTEISDEFNIPTKALLEIVRRISVMA